MGTCSVCCGQYSLVVYPVVAIHLVRLRGTKPTTLEKITDHVFTTLGGELISEVTRIAKAILVSQVITDIGSKCRRSVECFPI